MQITKNQ